MSKIQGFINHTRQTPKRRSANKRISDWKEVYTKWDEKKYQTQASRCMDCGVPFCNSGCPLGNLIPEFNNHVYNQDWKSAIETLHATNNFPEFTGRICPAPCEASCTLSINSDPVTIEMIEKNIAEMAWESGWIKPIINNNKTNKKVAVVGSGPAGLAAAQQLCRAGHSVTVFERNEYIGGLLSIGIPEFKLEKHIVDRRIDQMREEGVKFIVNTNVGIDVTSEELINEYDAVCLSGGSTIPRDLPIEGRNLNGIHFAMDFLSQQNKKLKGLTFDSSKNIDVKDKNVVIIGGGDTGADCLGTSHRQGAKNIVQMEIMSRPPIERNDNNPWPNWPTTFRTSSAHEEGGERDYNVLTKKFVGDDNNNLISIECIRVEWVKDNETGQLSMKEVPNTNFSIDAERVFLAMGFLHPQHEGLLESLKIDYDKRGNVSTNNNMMTSIEKIFSCGDMQRGQSLVVHAIASGRSCARNIDLFLMGKSNLPSVGKYVRPSISYT
ncbi:MAG: glutamate synthase subunit beta [Dehalococcoidia bacterium]